MINQHKLALMVGTARCAWQTPMAMARCFHDLMMLQRWCGAVVKKIDEQQKARSL